MSNLKTIVFQRVLDEFDAYAAVRDGREDGDVEFQRSRFCAVYRIVRDAGLEGEYQDWKSNQH